MKKWWREVRGGRPNIKWQNNHPKMPRWGTTILKQQRRCCSTIAREVRHLEAPQNIESQRLHARHMRNSIGHNTLGNSWSTTSASIHAGVVVKRASRGGAWLHALQKLRKTKGPHETYRKLYLGNRRSDAPTSILCGSVSNRSTKLMAHIYASFTRHKNIDIIRRKKGEENFITKWEKIHSVWKGSNTMLII